jgi:hypothetical protein
MTEKEKNEKLDEVCIALRQWKRDGIRLEGSLPCPFCAKTILIRYEKGAVIGVCETPHCVVCTG